MTRRAEYVCRHHPSGGEEQAVLSGPAVRLMDGLDRIFARLAGEIGAIEYRFPPLIDVRHLARAGYFESFPQHATMITTPARDAETIEAFARNNRGSDIDEIEIARQAPIRMAATPAACHHVYPHFAGGVLDGPLLVTTRNICCRHEERFEPLRRQWAFTMREIVCLGTEDEVAAVLAAVRGRVATIAARLEIAANWTPACDPFFGAGAAARRLYQQIVPVKEELTDNTGLAIASVNRHGTHFGAAFAIRRNERSAASGCIAFGLERWIAAVLHRHGDDPGNWPFSELENGNETGADDER